LNKTAATENRMDDDSAASSFNPQDWRFETLPSAADRFEWPTSIFRRSDTPWASQALFNCKLCGHNPRDAFSVDQMYHHCNDPRHFLLVSNLLSTQHNTDLELRRSHSNSERLASRIEQLGLAAWQHAVRSILYEYVHSAGAVDPARSRCIYSLALQSLVKYERLERISLIEMAAWKHSCIMLLDNDDDEEQQQPHETMSYLAMKEWERHGWKKIKSTMRRSEATNVIVQCVLPFLDHDPIGTITSNKKRRIVNPNLQHAETTALFDQPFGVGM
jgi:hypothetical protein